ncbi:MAG TPA: hypothetical protein PLP33_24950 [Leptospiraceae bacterium]|nr:hypothetical protein [Leptospiraceae bacterium]
MELQPVIIVSIANVMHADRLDMKSTLEEKLARKIKITEGLKTYLEPCILEYPSLHSDFESVA